MERFRTWHEVLMERLSDPEDVIGYLEVSLEEYLDDGDKAFFLKGIKNVIEAQGGILSVSEHAGIDPRFLSDIVNNGSMPPFHILSSIFTSFGAEALRFSLRSGIAETPLFLAQELLALTKMNWNNTQFDGREPITLRCARQVGQILKYFGPDDHYEPYYRFYM